MLVGIVSNMKAVQLVRTRITYAQAKFAELVLWEIRKPLPGCTHSYKYRLAFVVEGDCVLRYDNEAGKGDHKHVRGKEVKYRFVSADKLIADFFEDVRRWRNENSND